MCDHNIQETMTQTPGKKASDIHGEDLQGEV